MSLITPNQTPTRTVEQRLSYLASICPTHRAPTIGRLNDPGITELLGKVRSFERESHPQPNGRPAPETVLASKTARVVNFEIVDFKLGDDDEGPVRVKETLSVLFYENNNTFGYFPITKSLQAPSMVKCSKLRRPSGNINVEDLIAEQSLALDIAVLAMRSNLLCSSYEKGIEAVASMVSGDTTWSRLLKHLDTYIATSDLADDDDKAFVKFWYMLVYEYGEDICKSLFAAHNAIP